MKKLFSLFVKYSILPEKQFFNRASQKIYTLAQIAERQGTKGLGIRSQPQLFSVVKKNQRITITPQGANRQLFYQSPWHGVQRYSLVGNKWINSNEQELADTFQQDLKEMTK